MTTKPVYCFRGTGQQQLDGPASKEEHKEVTDPLDAIICKVCGRTVTSKAQKIAVNGDHSHTFFNPAGVVFELGCFREAVGCVRVGEATSEFTWFSGHCWRFALCRGCKSHLGWFFESEGQAFYGLILANITEK